MIGKKFTAVLLMGLVLTAPVRAAAAAPVDIQRHWAATAINTIMAHNLMFQRQDGRFQPDHAATREEGAVVLYRYLQVHPASGAMAAEPVATAFSDTAGRQSAGTLAELLARGILTGYPDGTFRPTEGLTRGMLSAMLYRCQQNGAAFFEPTEAPATVALSDLASCAEREAIQFFCDRGILTGRPDGTFHPNDPISRAELATVFYRLAGYEALVPAVELPAQRTMEVPYSSQIFPLKAWVGCEPTSLYMALQFKGHALNVTLEQFLASMPFDLNNPDRGFVGSPYKIDTALRTTIYPPMLAQYGRNYGGNVVNLSGASPVELQSELLSGNPAVVYLTLWWEEPRYADFIIDGVTQSLVANNHAVTVSGYDSVTGQYYITDPYNLKEEDTSIPYRYWVSGETFEHLYDVRRQAVVVRG